MTKKIWKVLTFAVFSCAFSTSSYGIKYSNVCDGAESILYGHKKISTPFLSKVIEKIDEPERDRRRQSIKIRGKEESEEVISNSKKALCEKVDKFKANQSNEVNEVIQSMNKRVKELLEFDLSSFDPIPLSYLLEKINNEYNLNNL